MQSYTLTDTCERNSEVFEKAAIEPVESNWAIATSQLIISTDI